MEQSRTRWPDDRLDDLSRRMDAGFDRVDKDIRELRADMGEGFRAVNARFDGLEARFDDRFDHLQRLMIQFMGGATVAVLGTVISVVLARG